MDKRDILVVFDIDETLIQFINKSAYHYWKEITPEQKQIIDQKLEYVDLGEEKKQVIFFRPGLRQFLEMARNSGRIKAAIWTYSERDYANAIANLICSKFSLSPDTFIFKYGSEDIKDHDIPKSLKQIWDDPKFGNKFNKFNTFLVDDRYGNLCHEINVANSILVQAFAPFGERKEREALTNELLEKAVNDHVFEELTKITGKLLQDIDGCQDEEIEEAFKVESIFAPKCMKRKGLENYIKQYEDDVQLCTIGEVENAASAIKGGRMGVRRKMKKMTMTRNSRRTARRTRRRTARRSKHKGKRSGKRTRGRK